MLFGNSSISPCITSDRPWMRQMPSVTETTVPCVRISRAGIQVLDAALDEFADFGRIELHVLLLKRPASCFERGLERAELRARRAVDHLVADARSARRRSGPGRRRTSASTLRAGASSRARCDEVGELRVGTARTPSGSRASTTPSRSFFSASNCARISGSSSRRPFSTSTRTKFSAVGVELAAAGSTMNSAAACASRQLRVGDRRRARARRSATSASEREHLATTGERVLRRRRA